MSASEEIAEFYVHTAEVRTRGASTAWGVEREAVVAVPCFIDWSTALVRDAAGNEIVAVATLTADVSYADVFAPGSVVSANGREAHVIAVAPAESGGLDLPDHVEVTLQ